jgi:predicted PurR-regulated permease PerM
VLGPFVFRRTVHLDPLVTLLGVLFLAELLGIAGAVVAVPAVALAQIVVRELIAARRDRVSAEAAKVELERAEREARSARPASR